MTRVAPTRCTGARQIATGLHELARRNGKVNGHYFWDGFRSPSINLKIPQVLVTSMCIGTGMGAAGVFVRE